MTTPANWSEARNLLAVRLDALGDVLMTTPALRALKESCPGCRLTLLTSPAGAEAARLVPEVDGAQVYEAPWVKATAPRTDSRPDFAMIDELRRRRFDAAVVFTVYSQNPLPAAFLCQLAGIPLRLAHCRENPYQLLTHWVPETEPDRGLRHEVRRQLDLVASVGCRTGDERLSLRVPEAARRRVTRVLNELGLESGDRWLLIHPGASAPSRRYPAEGFAAAARQLVREHDYRVVFTGTVPERELVDHIRERMGAPADSLAGALRLPEFAGLVAQAPLLISNNTGPVHVAAAVGTPVVDLYALTNPQHTPWGVPHRVLNRDVPCKYCYKSICPQQHHHCLTLVPPEDIVRAACELMSNPLSPFRREPWASADGAVGGSPDPLGGSLGAGLQTRPMRSPKARGETTRIDGRI